MREQLIIMIILCFINIIKLNGQCIRNRDILMEIKDFCKREVTMY